MNLSSSENSTKPLKWNDGTRLWAVLTNVEENGYAELQNDVRFPAQIQQIGNDADFRLAVARVFVQAILEKMAFEISLQPRGFNGRTVIMSLSKALTSFSCTKDRYEITLTSESWPNGWFAANTFNPFCKILQ